MDDDTERGCTLSFTSYWTGSVPPGHSSCSAAWRQRKGGMKRGKRTEIELFEREKRFEH